MVRAFLRLLARDLAATLEATVSNVNHNAVRKDLAGRAEISPSYLLMIVFSCLVALLGLLTNSIAVVIGAMLISPLMGPIFTASLAFSLGDLGLAKKALKIIAASILLSVMVATFFTLLSPLKAPTLEILSRTRPNIYDLLIAAIAGAAGAYALCTRVSYMFVTTGVAVATAVIPPLSVVGYGIGTGQPAIAMGGFLLFFTNLVAIVISSDLVFHVFRFRAIVSEEARYSVRKRVMILGTVLALISAPLIYTLVVDINKIKLTSRIERVLKSHLDHKDYSRMTSCSFQKGRDGLTVAASVNTVRYYDVSVEKKIEDELIFELKRPVLLDLEQVIVKPGRVEPQVPLLRTPVAVPSPQAQTLEILRQKAIERVRKGCEDLQPFLKPYPIRGCEISFAEQKASSTVRMTVARDTAFPEEERRWLNVALEKSLGEPLRLELDTVPFLPPLAIGPDGKLDEASRKALAVLKPLLRDNPGLHLVMTAPQTRRITSAHKNRTIKVLKDYLVDDLGLASEVASRGPDDGSDFRLRVERKR